LIYHKTLGMTIAGFAAGCITGLFGGGGGMVLVPLLTLLAPLQDREIFPASIAIILPICIVSLILAPSVYFAAALPYLPGSLLGGILAGKLGPRIPVIWLHRILGILILWGGFRYLC